MNIIQYFLSVIQCLLADPFFFRYIPLKQWAYDDSFSPNSPKFKVDTLPLITDFC